MSKNAFRRLSAAFKPTAPKPAGPTSVPESAPSSLAAFLLQSKDKFLNDLHASESPSRGIEWTLAMGNEAGDLDSIASSIAFAWVRSEVHKKPSIPLIQTDKEDLNLRAENLYAFKLAGIADPAKELLTSSDAPFSGTNSFALVDHNRLGAAFAEGNPTVVAVIDHHEDENLYTETADPRKIAPAGSCASHVTMVYAKDAPLPTELATLLLCAILIDTDGLRPGGKALQVDREAVAHLLPLSTFAVGFSPEATLPPQIKQLSDDLAARKSDVSHLAPWDLLRRDYKEYTYTLPWHADGATVKAGLSTVPVKLKACGGGSGALEKDALRWMEQQELTILGVLTSFRDTSKGVKRIGKKEGKHKREMAWFVRVRDGDGPDADTIAARLWKGLEADAEIRVKLHKMKLLVDANGVHGRVYKQGNAKATRKATAPLLKNIMESAS
ncbi:DHH phosphoesterase [Mycena kentingensis (nom. inval.)]|nr:DHH phosphoesterase [Mycena kentingensis (nom. inval.)]